MLTEKDDGTVIRYEDHGSGEPLVMIGGFGADATFWDAAMPELDGLRVVTVDNRGVGDTRYSGAFTVVDMADDVCAVLDRLGLPDANIFGWSMGSQIAQCLAVRHPERVRTLTLVSSYLRFPSRADYVLRTLTRMAADDRAPPECLAVTVNALCFPESTFEYLRSNGIVMPVPDKEVDLNGLLDQLDAMATYSGEGLGNVDAPTLVVHGTRDAMIEPDNGVAVAGAIRGSKLLLVDAGHNVPLDLYRERLLELVRRKR